MNHLILIDEFEVFSHLYSNADLKMDFVEQAFAILKLKRAYPFSFTVDFSHDGTATIGVSQTDVERSIERELDA